MAGSSTFVSACGTQSSMASMLLPPDRARKRRNRSVRSSGAEPPLTHRNVTRAQRLIESNPYQIRMLVIVIMGYQLWSADRGAPQCGEWLWNR